uniref:WGS project CBMG000000000 data, contig CS5907-c003526 n=1 Tax=Fusarium acuminatum CS5907 TaxID=1318461 RepID=A0A090MG96_9HYPO|nr:unnamed protein product [Fusarium acuminatum CS5907]
MLDLSSRVHFLTNTAQKIVARTTGVEPLSLPRDDCTIFEAYYKRTAQVLEIVEKAGKRLVLKREGETVAIGLGPGKPTDMECRDYAQGYGIPNVFFHLTTAYAILRKEGIELGKQDHAKSFKSQ